MSDYLLAKTKKACYINFMFSSRKCAIKNCHEHAVTGSRYCYAHLDNFNEYIQNISASLSDCDTMSNYKLCHAELSGITVPCRNIITSKFSETVFNNMVFDDLSIKLCFFDFCQFNNCSFRKSDIRYSVFGGSVFYNCNFIDSEILHSNFNGSTIKNTVFESCDLYYSSYISAGIQDSSFKDCNLKKVSYLNSTINNTSFKYSNHEEAEFDKGQMP